MEVREALAALKAESEATRAAAAAAPPAAEEGGAPPNVALSLACIGCFAIVVGRLVIWITVVVFTRMRCELRYPSHVYVPIGFGTDFEVLPTLLL